MQTRKSRLLLLEPNNFLILAVQKKKKKSIVCTIFRGAAIGAGRYDTLPAHGLRTSALVPVAQITPANLEHAFRRFREEYKRPIQQKVMKILHHWVRYHFYDFENDGQLLQRLVEFLNGNEQGIKISVPLKKLCAKIMASSREASALFYANFDIISGRP